MSNKKSKISETKGLSPGTLVYTGNSEATECKVELHQYNENAHEFHTADNWDAIQQKIKPEYVNWVDVSNLNNIPLIEAIGKHFDFHALLLEDILAVDFLPKVEDYESYLLFSLKMLSLNKDTGSIQAEHVSFVLGNNYLVSFQEKQGDVFDAIRDRIIHSKGRVRRKKADYLMLILIDVIVDNYYAILDDLHNRIQTLKDELLNKTIEQTERRILKIRKRLMLLRKNILPLKESMRQLLRDEPDLIDETTLKYYRDVNEHISYVTETIDGFKDSISGLIDLYDSNLNNRLNNIIKVLTIVSSIFIPLSFIAGVYGMNFENMPELKSQYGYFIVLSVMGTLGFGMLVFMIRKKWL
jgi:magnesium transporter